MNRRELRSAACDIFQDALRAVDARGAVQRAVRFDRSTLFVFTDEFRLVDRPIYVIAAGKAAVSMSLGLSDVFGSRIERGITSSLNTPDAPSLPKDFTTFYGGHPLPNLESLSAAEA